MDVSSKKLLFLLIVGTTLVRVVWAAALETSNDEGYHYLYTVHPALSYFDHPPMTAWLAKAGLVVFGGWVHPLSLRFMFILLFAGSTWVMFQWTARWYGERAGLASAVALNLSAYFTAAAGAFALPDGPFLFFALITMWALSEALVGERKYAWLGVGVGFAGAMLSKYHGVFLPAGALLYIALTPSKRRVLLTAGPYIAVLMGVIGFLPVLIWNYEHGWASFKFQGGRAVGFQFRPEGILVWSVGPLLYLLPWIWFGLLVELYRRVRRYQEISGNDRLLVCQCIGPLAFFFLVSCVRWVLFHWNLIGFLPLYPLLGKHWAELEVRNPKLTRVGLLMMTTALVFIMGLGVAQARVGLVKFEGKDAVQDISGWESVAKQLEERKLLEKPTDFVITNKWYESGQMAFAIRNKLPVVCYHSLDARGFAFWSRPDDWKGKNGLVVLVDSANEPSVEVEIASFFARTEQIAEFHMMKGPNPYRPVKVFRVYNQLREYPFSYKAISPEEQLAKK